MTVAEKLAWVWGEVGAPFSIGYDRPLSAADSGYTILLDSAPAPEDVRGNPPDHPALSWQCLYCVIEHYPEVGAGLDLAREHGAADLDEGGEWVGRVVPL